MGMRELPEAPWKSSERSSGSHHRSLTGRTSARGAKRARAKEHAQEMARSPDLPQIKAPLSGNMPDDPTEQKWYHRQMPQIMYRIVTPDLDCLKSIDHPVRHLSPSEVDYKLYLYDSVCLCFTPDKRSPFIHGCETLEDAQSSLKSATKLKRYKKKRQRLYC